MTEGVDILVVDPSPEWPDRPRVVASAPPRVVVLRTEPGSATDVVAHGRLVIVRNADGSNEEHGGADVVAELDDGARLFVEAWRQSPAAKSARPGEGLSWDSPGFEPPDRPPQ